MSAFLVSPEHIQQLCAFHKANSPQDHAARPTAKILAVGNLNSIKARYPARWAEFLGDRTVDEYLRECGRVVAADTVLAEPDIAAMIHCYEYQACEVNPWERSDAWYLCQVNAWRPFLWPPYHPTNPTSSGRQRPAPKTASTKKYK